MAKDMRDDINGLVPFIGMPALEPGEEVKVLREAARWEMTFE
jgi:hypothetical protein